MADPTDERAAAVEQEAQAKFEALKQLHDQGLISEDEALSGSYGSMFDPAAKPEKTPSLWDTMAGPSGAPEPPPGPPDSLYVQKVPGLDPRLQEITPNRSAYQAVDPNAKSPVTFGQGRFITNNTNMSGRETVQYLAQLPERFMARQDDPNDPHSPVKIFDKETGTWSNYDSTNNFSIPEITRELIENATTIAKGGTNVVGKLAAGLGAIPAAAISTLASGAISASEQYAKTKVLPGSSMDFGKVAEDASMSALSEVLPAGIKLGSSKLAARSAAKEATAIASAAKETAEAGMNAAKDYSGKTAQYVRDLYAKSGAANNPTVKKVVDGATKVFANFKKTLPEQAFITQTGMGSKWLKGGETSAFRESYRKLATLSPEVLQEISTPFKDISKYEVAKKIRGETSTRIYGFVKAHPEAVVKVDDFLGSEAYGNIVAKVKAPNIRTNTSHQVFEEYKNYVNELARNFEMPQAQRKEIGKIFASVESAARKSKAGEIPNELIDTDAIELILREGGTKPQPPAKFFEYKQAAGENIGQAVKSGNAPVGTTKYVQGQIPASAKDAVLSALDRAKVPGLEGHLKDLETFGALDTITSILDAAQASSSKGFLPPMGKLFGGAIGTKFRRVYTTFQKSSQHSKVITALQNAGRFALGRGQQVASGVADRAAGVVEHSPMFSAPKMIAFDKGTNFMDKQLSMDRFPGLPRDPERLASVMQERPDFQQMLWNSPNIDPTIKDALFNGNKIEKETAVGRIAMTMPGLFEPPRYGYPSEVIRNGETYLVDGYDRARMLQEIESRKTSMDIRHYYMQKSAMSANGDGRVIPELRMDQSKLVTPRDLPPPTGMETGSLLDDRYLDEMAQTEETVVGPAKQYGF
jgi:hypothetical protein